MFDVTLQIIDIKILEAEDHLEWVAVLGLSIPVGPGQFASFPGGIVRQPLSRDMALEYGKELVDKAEKLPPPKRTSDLVIPGDPSAAEQAAKFDAQLRNPHGR